MHRLRPASPKAARWLALTLVPVVSSLALPAFSAAEGIEGAANYNSEECSGHLKPGKAETEVEEGTAIRYSFSCNGPITGYQIESQLPITGSSSAPLASNANGEVLPDALSCSTGIPGYAVNCVGAQGTTAADQTLTGVFYIESKLCQEPREDALLTVTYAYMEKGVITQAISGPFDLGKPQGCKASKSKRDRLEVEPVKEAEEATAKAKQAKQKAAEAKQKAEEARQKAEEAKRNAEKHKHKQKK